MEIQKNQVSWLSFFFFLSVSIPFAPSYFSLLLVKYFADLNLAIAVTLCPVA